MLVPRQQYSRELKIAVMREIDSGKSMAEVARKYQLSPKRLEAWKPEWRANGELAFPGHQARPQSSVDAERNVEVYQAAGLLTANPDGTVGGIINYNDLTWVGAQSPSPITGGTYTMTRACRIATMGAWELGWSGCGGRWIHAQPLCMGPG
jgi:transposase-like protein